MAKIQVSETVAAPPERVFALFSDFRHTAEHVEGISHCEVLTDGSIGVDLKKVAEA